MSRCRARRNGSPTARRSTSGAASAATGRRATATVRPRPSSTVQRPRNFTNAVFKFRLTKEPVPTDGDLLRTITRGVRGTAMPAWYSLPLDDRLAVIQYIKYVLAVDRSRSRQALCLFHRRAAWTSSIYRQAAGADAAAPRSRQGSLGASQMLGVPRQDRQGRRREGRRPQGRRGLHRSFRPTSPAASSSRGRRSKTSSAPFRPD